jgi:excinuclease ABC subunit C
MRDRRGVIVYIGKAKDLKRRVSSYFRPGARHSPKTASMVSVVYDFDFITVKNDAEALLTESELIKKHKPKFNILMRDDKRYLALRADTTLEWPRFTCVRTVREDGARYFGPFPSSTVVRAAKDFTEKFYGIRQCKVPEPDIASHKHCMADIIRTCSAPCLGKITKDEYRKRFEEACEFLEGKHPALINEMEQKMRLAAESGEYEEAAGIRDTVFALKEMTKTHYVRKTDVMRQVDAYAGISELAEVIGLEKPPRIIECVDISNLFGEDSVASLVVSRDGIPDKRYYRHFRIKTVQGADDPRSMAEVVRRRYGDGVLSKSLPKADLFICDGGITQVNAALAAFREIAVNDVPIVGLAEKQEEIVFPDGRPNLFLPRDSNALFVCTRLRDEAHRFALSYHRRLRDKAMKRSILDEIAGIGPVKKAALLKTFGSLRGISSASAEKIAAAASISLDLAENVSLTVRQYMRNMV